MRTKTIKESIPGLRQDGFSWFKYAFLNRAGSITYGETLAEDKKAVKAWIEEWFMNDDFSYQLCKWLMIRRPTRKSNRKDMVCQEMRRRNPGHNPWPF